jgi:hypothetical protein
MRKLLLASVLAMIPLLANAQPFDGHWYMYDYNTGHCGPSPSTPEQTIMVLLNHYGKVYAEQLAGEGVGKPTAYAIGHYDERGQEHHVMVFKYFNECQTAPKGYAPHFPG